MGKIHVHVVRYRDCRHLILRYVDPVTGPPRQKIQRHGKHERGPAACPRMGRRLIRRQRQSPRDKLAAIPAGSRMR